jgi:hypothetical protein
MGMIAVYAQELGISVEDLNTRLTNGETIAQIAAEKGLTAEQFSALMADAHSQAIDQAVNAGTLTQEQAEWLKTRGGAFGNTGARGTGRGGMRGQGMGMADCPYYHPDKSIIPSIFDNKKTRLKRRVFALKAVIFFYTDHQST